MRIALIGMSGAGKSFWSAVLQRHGFEVFCCDDHIGRRLAAAGEIGDASLEQLGQWMGFPFEPDFDRREARYLSLENAIMDRLLSDLEALPGGKAAPDLVVDTTGSVVYTGDAIMQRLQRQAVVVYLAPPPTHHVVLRRAYEENPRPVIWHGHFSKRQGETNPHALKRCYASLLAERDKLYRRYAHLEIQWTPAAGPTPAADTLLAPVTAFLNKQGASRDV
jgi:shikimate kinase